MLNSWLAVNVWDDFVECSLSFIRVTREHREMLVKLAKQNTNKAKDSLRKVRTNAMNKLKKSKDKASEDTIRLIEKQVLLPTDVVLMYLTQKITCSCLKWGEWKWNTPSSFTDGTGIGWVSVLDLALHWTLGIRRRRGSCWPSAVFQALSWMLYSTSFILITTKLWGGWWGNWGPQKVDNLPKVTLLVNGSSGIQTQQTDLRGYTLMLSCLCLVVWCGELGTWPCSQCAEWWHFNKS